MKERRFRSIGVDDQIERSRPVPAGELVQGEILEPDSWMKQLRLVARDEPKLTCRV